MSKSDFGPLRIDTFPSESDSETMRKVLKWGVVPFNLEGHGMDPYSFSWARINSPVNIRRFNSRVVLATIENGSTSFPGV